jgi:hypothetical protein
MIVRQSSGHFSREKGEVSVRHERYFLAIPQQKPGKCNFLVKKIFYGAARVRHSSADDSKGGIPQGHASLPFLWFRCMFKKPVTGGFIGIWPQLYED